VTTVRTRSSLDVRDVHYVLFWTLFYRMVSVVVVMFTIPMRPALPAWMADAYQRFSYPLCLYSLALLLFRRKLATFLLRHPYFLVVDLIVAVGILQMGGSWRSSYFAYTVTTIMMFTAFEGRRGAHVSALVLTAVAIVKDPSGGRPSFEIFYISDWDMRVGAAFFYLGTGLIFGYFHSLLLRLESLSREKIEETRKRAAAEEKSRVVLELHDGAKQMVTAMLLRMSPLIKEQQPRRDQKAEEVRWLWVGMNYLKSELNQVMDALRSGGDDSRASCNLVELIESEAKIVETMTGFSWRVAAAAADIRVSPRSKLSLRRFVTEALMNAWKHSGETGGTIDVGAADGSAVITIIDVGRGFTHADALAADTTGLRSLEHRARELGGRLAVETMPGKGCRLSLTIPIR
jgi:signal transduction histidine kinase